MTSNSGGVFPSGYLRSENSHAGTQGRQDLLEFTGERSTGPSTSRRRRTLAGVAGLILVTGLVTHFALVSAAGNFVADALYAIMVFLVLSFAFPRTSGWRIGLVALTLCVGIELFQLTGVPAALGEVFPPLRLLLGTTFSEVDLIAYLVGALGAAIVGTWRRQD